MRIDFYQLERDPPERVVPMLASKAIDAGARLAILCADEGERARLSDALWSHSPDGFLANGEAGGVFDSRQPILLGSEPTRSNGATVLLLADGRWREPEEGVERVLFLFRPDAAASARDRWKALDGGDRHYWAQDAEGRWAERG